MEKDKFHKIMQACMLLFDEADELDVIRDCGLVETNIAKYIIKFVTTYK